MAMSDFTFRALLAAMQIPMEFSYGIAFYMYIQRADYIYKRALVHKLCFGLPFSILLLVIIPIWKFRCGDLSDALLH